MDYRGLILVVVGCFVLFASYRDFEWYMNNPKTRMLTEKLGRNKARSFHMGLSTIMIIVGILVTTEIF